MLCGCITTSTRFISTPKSQCASIISRPLLNNVAESIVIFGPIFQVGCFNACSGVMESNPVRGVSRNGPPDAVSRMRRTSETSHAEADFSEDGLRRGERPTPNVEVSALDIGR